MIVTRKNREIARDRSRILCRLLSSIMQTTENLLGGMPQIGPVHRIWKSQRARGTSLNWKNGSSSWNLLSTRWKSRTPTRRPSQGMIRSRRGQWAPKMRGRTCPFQEARAQLLANRAVLQENQTTKSHLTDLTQVLIDLRHHRKISTSGKYLARFRFINRRKMVRLSTNQTTVKNMSLIQTAHYTINGTHQDWTGPKIRHIANKSKRKMSGSLKIALNNSLDLKTRKTSKINRRMPSILSWKAHLKKQE